MIIGGVHWFLAVSIAVVVHLAGMLWLSLGEPIRQIEPDRASGGIVVTLGRQAGSAGEAAQTVAADQGEPVMDAEEVDAARSEEAEPPPDPASEASGPAPDEAAADPPQSADRPEDVQAAAAIEPEAATPRQAADAATEAPETTSPETAAEAASPEPEAVSARPAVDASPADPESVEAREVGSTETVETRDARVVAGTAPRREAGDSVPVEFADTATVPEAPDAAAKTPEAEALWSGSTPESPEAETTAAASSPSAESPKVDVARDPPAESTMQLEPVEPASLQMDNPAVTAARQPVPEVERAFEPDAGEAPAPEVVNLQELQEREGGGTGVVARYAGVIKGWLQKNMHYPRAARLAGQEGDAVVRFIIDRDGRVQSVELESGSGYPLLDREAREMIERGDPFPAMPVEMPGQRLEVRVPVSFHVRDETRQKEIPPIYLD